MRARFYGFEGAIGDVWVESGRVVTNSERLHRLLQDTHVVDLATGREVMPTACERYVANLPATFRGASLFAEVVAEQEQFVVTGPRSASSDDACMAEAVPDAEKTLKTYRGMEAEVERLAAALAGIVDEERRRSFVVVDADPDRGYFVQFASDGQGGLRAETVSNEYLDEEHRLSPQQERVLSERGWTAPSSGDNWSRRVQPSPQDLDRIAREALEVLRDVYGLQLSDGLRLYDEDGDLLDTAGEARARTLGLRGVAPVQATAEGNEMEADSLIGVRNQVERALRISIGELREFTIIYVAHQPNYYVQWVGHDDGDVIVLNCEAVSDEFLEPDEKLTEESIRRLESLGWIAPGTKESRSPNWWRQFTIANIEDSAEPTSLLAATLREVYGCTSEAAEVKFGDRAITLTDLKASDELKELIRNLGLDRGSA